MRLSAKTTETLSLQPYEPYYYACKTNEHNEYRENSALSYLIRRHDDHLRGAWHYEVLENGTIPLHVFHHVDNPLEYTIVKAFRGIKDNSPLCLEDNSLISVGHKLYDGLRGHDEWKIAMLGVKIHSFICWLDVQWEHWVQGDMLLHEEALDRVREHIFLAHHKWRANGDYEEWKAAFEVREGLDNCRERRIGKPDRDENRPEGLMPHAIVLASRDELNPYLPHIRYAKNHATFTESCVLFDDERPLTFLDPRQSPLSEVRQNPWLPI